MPRSGTSSYVFAVEWPGLCWLTHALIAHVGLQSVAVVTTNRRWQVRSGVGSQDVGTRRKFELEPMTADNCLGRNSPVVVVNSHHDRYLTEVFWTGLTAKPGDTNDMTRRRRTRAATNKLQGQRKGCNGHCATDHLRMVTVDCPGHSWLRQTGCSDVISRRLVEPDVDDIWNAGIRVRRQHVVARWECELELMTGVDRLRCNSPLASKDSDDNMAWAWLHPQSARERDTEELPCRWST